MWLGRLATLWEQMRLDSCERHAAIRIGFTLGNQVFESRRNAIAVHLHASRPFKRNASRARVLRYSEEVSEGTACFSS